MTASSIIIAAEKAAWGPATLILLIGTGLFLSIRLGFLQFRRFGFAMKNTIGKALRKQTAGKGEITPLQAMTTALAATVGTGNISGVTGAIVVGGPGAVFWMWVSAFIGMATKYAEIVLAVKFRERNSSGEWAGGPMYYIKNGLGKKWEWLGVLFCVFAGLAAFGIGNAAQAESISSAVNNAIRVCTGSPCVRTAVFFGREVPLSSLAAGVCCSVITALALFGGVKRIGSVTEKLVPVMAAAYIISALAVVLSNSAYIGDVFAMIFKGAFSAEAVLGGGFGITLTAAVRSGVSRGCFSNEAGLGSAPMAHASTSETIPAAQGLYGIFEVFMDTIVICTLTSLVVLTGYLRGIPVPWGGSGGCELVTASMSTVFGGRLSAVIISVCLILFALSSILSWALYGSRCCEYLFGGRAACLYRIVFVLFINVGAVISLTDAWNLASALNGFMAIPNLTAVAALSGTVVRETRRYFGRARYRAPSFSDR